MAGTDCWLGAHKFPSTDKSWDILEGLQSEYNMEVKSMDKPASLLLGGQCEPQLQQNPIPSKLLIAKSVEFFAMSRFCSQSSN
jgi:hypothetical protein